jgi:putative sigma-54 modulation protein
LLFSRRVVRGPTGVSGKESTVQIEIATRHGDLGSGQHAYLHEKAEKLVKYFDRIMAIEIAADHLKHAWKIEIRVSAEHKHDFFAAEDGPTPEAAMDQCVHKIENQLRKYKERVQNHKGDAGFTSESPGPL